MPEVRKSSQARGEETMINLKALITAEDKRKKALASAMATAVLATGLIATAGGKPAQAAFSGDNGRIVF
jgi:hypothetical protein